MVIENIPYILYPNILGVFLLNPKTEIVNICFGEEECKSIILSYLLVSIIRK